MAEPTLPGSTGDTAASSPNLTIVETIAASLRLPPFWATGPQMWFGQVEAQFLARHITSQATKYGHAVTTLPSETAAEVRDVILAPPTDRTYDKIKEELIKRTAVSEQRRLHQLLNSEDFGDRSPSQLLRRMRQLLGNNTADTPILQQLFLQRLRTQVKLFLTAADELSLVQLAQLADKVLDLSDPGRIAVITTPATTPVGHTDSSFPYVPLPPPCPALRAPADSMEATVAALTANMHNLQATVASLSQIMANLLNRDIRDPAFRRPRYRSPRRSSPRRRRPAPSPGLVLFLLNCQECHNVFN